MKKFIKITVLALILSIPIMLSAQPQPNNGGGAPGGGNVPVGGGAPIGSGLVIMIALGAAYGGAKIFKRQKSDI